MRQDLLPTTVDGKLAKVVEECGEFLQAYGKYIRHGSQATDPLTGHRYDNMADMRNEMKDIAHALLQLGIVPITQHSTGNKPNDA